MENEKKKRIAIIKFDTLTTRMDYGFITNEEFEQSLDKYAAAYKIDKNQILTYDVGTEEQVENGTMFFCPRCGQYNEYGFDPSVNQAYRRNPETKKMEVAGYYKYVPLECDNCNELFRIDTETFDLEMAKWNEELDEIQRSNNQTEDSTGHTGNDQYEGLTGDSDGDEHIAHEGAKE